MSGHVDPSPGGHGTPPACTRDVGLGTAYERVAVQRLIESWCGHPPPRTALEGPVDGMAGIPGLHLLPLARLGTRVTVATPRPEAADRVRRSYERAGLAGRLELLVSDAAPRGDFDLVLSFNALPLVPDWRAYLAQQLRATRRSAVIVVSNRDSYGAACRRAFSRLGGPEEPGSHLFDHESTHAATLRRALRRFGDIADEAFLDCPWWPDLFVPTGSTLWGATAGRLLRRRPPAVRPAARRFCYGAQDHPYVRGRPPPELCRALRRHPSFEHATAPLARFFGHHRAYLLSRP